MTNVAEAPKTVYLKCLGIVQPMGFNLAPDGHAPSYVQFQPGKATPVKKHEADYLIAQDPHRFKIDAAPEMKQPETPAAPAPEKTAKAKTAKKK